MSEDVGRAQVQATYRILLAEDDRFLRRACDAALRRRGFTVHLAEDGEQALTMARAQRPDLMLLDMLMPKLFGIDVLRALRADAATRDIPVLILSNSSREGDRRNAEELGAIGYLIKAELSLKDLVEKIDAVLGRSV
jgi:CheY-like chemotaxis protein